MKLCRRTSSAILRKIEVWNLVKHFSCLRPPQNLDDLDDKLPILPRRTASQWHADRLPPSPRPFCMFCTVPVVIPRPPFAVRLSSPKSVGAAGFAQGSDGSLFEGRRPPPSGIPPTLRDALLSPRS